MAASDQDEINSYRDRPIHEDVAPIIWLHGKWKADDGQGVFPSVPSFTYAEEIQFSSVGQPGLIYNSFSWNPEKKMPMHLESGFLRVKPGSTELAFIVAHNFGVATVEEGEVTDQVIQLSCDQVQRMSFSKGPQVTKTARTFTLKSDGVLEQILHMETATTPLTEHLRITYRKVD